MIDLKMHGENMKLKVRVFHTSYNTVFICYYFLRNKHTKSRKISVMVGLKIVLKHAATKVCNLVRISTSVNSTVTESYYISIIIN